MGSITHENFLTTKYFQITVLAIVQLTRQVDNGWFSPVFYNFLMEFINIGPVYIRGGQEGRRGGVGCGKSLIKEERRHKYCSLEIFRC